MEAGPRPHAYVLLLEAEVRAQILDRHRPGVAERHLLGAEEDQVLRNLDAHSVVLGLLRLPLERIPNPGQLDSVSDEERKNLFQTCYEFLRVFCKSNTTNQEIIFSQTELFFAHVGIATRALYIAFLCEGLHIKKQFIEPVTSQLAGSAV